MPDAEADSLVVATPSRVPLKIKILYGAGECANSIKIVTFGLYSLFFATSVMGLPGTWIGVVGLIAMVWDAVIDPFIGYQTDGQGARSRRLAFMLAGSLTMGLGYWAFFSPPLNLSTPVLFAWLLAASFIVRTATSMFSIPYCAVGVSLTQNYEERTSVMAIRGMASTAGTLLTAVLSFVLFFPERTPGVDPKLDVRGYASMGLAFGAVMTMVSLATVLGIRWLPARVEGAEGSSEPAPAFFATAKEALRNTSFRRLLLSSCLAVTALTVNGSLVLHYLKHYVQVNSSAALSSTQGAFFLSGLIATLFWLRLSRHVDKHRLYMLSAVMTGVVMLGGLLLMGEGTLFGTGDIRPALAAYALAGFFNSVLWFVPPSMLADVADESEVLTSRRHEGAFFGILSFSHQSAAGVGILIAGLLLDRFAGLAPGGAPQSASTVYRIAVVYSVVPAVLFALAAVPMLNYRLTRSRVALLQQQLQQRLRMVSVEPPREHDEGSLLAAAPKGE